MTSQFERYIEEIIRRTLYEGGSASNPEKFSFYPPRDLWCFPKYPSRTDILPRATDLVQALKEFLERNKDVLKEEDCWLGTWLNPKTDEVYLDVSTGCEDLEAAQKLTVQVSSLEGRRIVAMFNPKQNKTIYLWEEERGD